MSLQSRTSKNVSVWIAAVLVGAAAVLYAKAISFVQGIYFSAFNFTPFSVTALSPLLFLLAAGLVRWFAPHAKGSGIPQVLEAIEEANANPSHPTTWKSPLVSLRTAGIKVLSSMLGILGGASIGREGPTVQIASSLFCFVGGLSQRFSSKVTMTPFLTAGAAAGVAAAFNTPLAGITFAIEEVIDGSFGSFRQTLMLSVIIAGITSQAIIGDYLYFGHPQVAKPDLTVIYEALLIGLSGGLFGGLFARILAYPKLTRLPRHWIIRAILCGIICAALSYFTNGATAGSGYETTAASLRADSPIEQSLFFPLLKMSTTIFSYLSGMAGGIFSPCLSIGSGIGITIAKIFHLANFRTCALIGMVAFFSGVIQAPFTAVIIVTEMTDEHILILPFLIAAFIGQTISRRIMPIPLYRFLAERKEDA